MGSGFFPLDRQLALRNKHCSAGVAYRVTWLSGLLPFATASEVLEQVGHVALSAATVWRPDAGVGRGISSARGAGTHPGAGPPDHLASGAAGGAGADGGGDGWGDGASPQEGWKELKVGCVYEIEPHTVQDPVTGEHGRTGARGPE